MHCELKLSYQMHHNINERSICKYNLIGKCPDPKAYNQNILQKGICVIIEN